MVLEERLLTLRNISAVAAWNSALQDCIFVFVPDVSKCAIARNTVKKSIGKSTIAKYESWTLLEGALGTRCRTDPCLPVDY